MVFSTGLPIVDTTTAFAAGGPSSSYRYLKGIGKVDYKMFSDTSRGIVLHDFNGDGYTDVGYGTGGIVYRELNVREIRPQAAPRYF